MDSSGIHRFIAACRCNIFSCVCCSSSSGVLGTISMLVSFLWASINKILASILGLGLALVSLIPVPRLRQWCPPQMAIFDALIAITIGIVLYVLILWAVVSFLGSGEESSSREADQQSGAADRSNKYSYGFSVGSESDETVGSESDETDFSGAYAAYKEDEIDGDYQSEYLTNPASQETDSGISDESQGQALVSAGFENVEDEDSRAKIPNVTFGLDQETTRPKQTYQSQPKTPRDYQEGLLRMTVVKRDSVDIPPSDFQPETNTAETQVRPKSRAASRSSALEQFTMHILEISPEEAVIEESEYTESRNSSPLCGHCGADYCDDTTCPCGTGCATSNTFPNDKSENMKADERSEAEKEEDKPKEESINEDELSMMGVDRSEDLARWVSQVDPNFDDDEEKRSQTDDLENVNNNNRWRGIGKRSSGIDGDSSSSSGTLKDSRWRASSSDSSEYLTAEEENQNNNAKDIVRRERPEDALGEGDGLGMRRWRQERRPDALIQKRPTGRDLLNSELRNTKSAAGRNVTVRARGRSTTSNASGDNSKMSTTDTTRMSSLQSEMPSEMPSTTDGVALISPPPITLNAPSSEAELTLTQQLRAAKCRPVILEGGGDCDVNQLNNRLFFMDTYQQHLFEKTAVHVFGTANVDTFCEQT